MLKNLLTTIGKLLLNPWYLQERKIRTHNEEVERAFRLDQLQQQSQWWEQLRQRGLYYHGNLPIRLQESHVIDNQLETIEWIQSHYVSGQVIVLLWDHLDYGHLSMSLSDAIPFIEGCFGVCLGRIIPYEHEPYEHEHQTHNWIKEGF